MHTKSPVTIFILALFSLVLWVGSASASSVYITYESVYTSGSAAPVSPITPWLTALFEDKPNGDVLLTLSAPNLTGTEFVSEWFFNFTTEKNVDNLVFSALSDGNPNSVSPLIYSGKKLIDYTLASGFSGQGIGNNGFKIDIPFVSSNNDGSRFTDEHYSRILISGLNDMVVLAEDFHVPVFKDDVEFISVAHVQAINGENSAWLKGYDPPPPVATPEPASLILMGVGALGAAFLRRRMAKAS